MHVSCCKRLIATRHNTTQHGLGTRGRQMITRWMARRHGVSYIVHCPNIVPTKAVRRACGCRG
eukprot:scaffold6711_cov118-Isochrysis_galbana.AAC.12